MTAVPVLETPRLRLRGWQAEDFDAFAAMMADSDVARFLTLDQLPMDRATAWRSMAMLAGHWHLRGCGMFVLEEKASGTFVGRAGPWQPEGWAGFEIGWGLVRGAWGRGFATEAAAAAGAWAFQTFGLTEVISLIHADNVRSQAVARRLGAIPATPTLHAGMPHTIWRAQRGDWQFPLAGPNT